jgi:glucose/arabinose dehydrogenase
VLSFVAVAMAAATVGCVRPPTGFPPGFHGETVLSGLSWPTAFVPLSTDDAFILEKPGLVRVMRDDRLVPRPVIDIRDHVNNYTDAGLTSLALDPEFDENGYLYLGYVYEEPGLPEDHIGQTQRVTRITVVDDVADPASEVVILGSVTGPACYDAGNWRTNDCIPLQGYHTLDDMAFDPSGALLVSIGDGAGNDVRLTISQRAQDVQVLSGKVLRIDKATGHGLPDNPFAAYGPDTNVGRVWAYGFRNPFRFTVRPGTSDVYLGDVGEYTWEEIDVVRPAANHGWPCIEGDERRTTAANRPFCERLYQDIDAGRITVTAPAVVYRHTAADGGAIVGGAFYTGTNYPEEYRGDYFFGDYAIDFIRHQDFDAAGTAVGPSVDFADRSAVPAPSYLRSGPDGNLWYLTIGDVGTLRRVVWDGSDPAPGSCRDNQYRVEYFNDVDLGGERATVQCEGPIAKRLRGLSPAPGVQVDGWSLRATGRLVLDGGTYRIRSESNDGKRVWLDGALIVDDWNDSPTPDGVSVVSHDVLLASGSHAVVMEFYDRADDATAVLDVTRLGSPPVVRVDVPEDLVRVAPGTSVAYSASATDAEDGLIAAGDITVDVTMRHFSGEEAHTHPFATDQPNPGSVVLTDAHGTGDVMFELRAKATDSSGIPTVSDPVQVCLVGGDVGPCA